MRLLKIIDKLWNRITETRWTILYIKIAAIQLIVTLAIEAVILKLNEDTANKLLFLQEEIESGNDMSNRVYEYQNYTYDSYRTQFLSIVHGNIWFMVFEAFLMFLCLSALFFQNTIEVITVGVINLILLMFSGIKIGQSFKWITRINNQIKNDINSGYVTGSDVSEISKTVITWEIVQLLIVAGFAATLAFLGYKLYQHFGWNIYKKIGANIQMQAMYRTYLVFLLLIKLNGFLLLGFQILILSFIFSENASDNTRTIVFQSIMVIIVIPTIGLALWGVRRENKVAMFVYAIASIFTIANFIYILAYVIIKRDETLLTLMDILGIVLIVSLMIISYLAARNFGLGLKDHFQKKDYDVGVDLESSGVQQQTRRFSIDD